MNLADIRQLFEYTEWANERILDAVDKCSDDDLRRDFGVSHRSIFETLLHTAGADWIWLERWNGRSPAKDEAWSQWTISACPNLGALRARWSALAEDRRRYISEIDESALDAELPFKLLSGDASSMRLADQMQHVTNHATMHRGQIVSMIRQLGIEPPATDLIFYLRSEISPK